MNLKHMTFWLLLFLSLPTIVSAQQATKTDIQALELKLTNQINELDKKLTNQINELDKRLTSLEITVTEMDKRITSQFQAVNVRIDELDKRLTARIDLLFWAIGALIGIVLTVIALPQLLGYFQEKRGREELQKQIQDLRQHIERQQQEIEALKSRPIVTSS